MLHWKPPKSHRATLTMQTCLGCSFARDNCLLSTVFTVYCCDCRCLLIGYKAQSPSLAPTFRTCLLVCQASPCSLLGRLSRPFSMPLFPSRSTCGVSGCCVLPGRPCNPCQVPLQTPSLAPLWTPMLWVRLIGTISRNAWLAGRLVHHTSRHHPLPRQALTVCIDIMYTNITII